MGFVAFIKKGRTCLISLCGYQDFFGLNSLDLSTDRFYKLRKGVRVRKERFGLLFYCRDGPKLTFVYSGSWIHPDFFSGRFTLREWLQQQSSKDSEAILPGLEAKISMVLSKLVKKGLIVETLGDA